MKSASYNKKIESGDTSFEVMIKPAGARCDLRCRYCHYSEKVALYKDTEGETQMSEACLEAVISKQIKETAEDTVVFNWSGGEALNSGIAFYGRAVALQRQYGSGKTIQNKIVTNGTLLDGEWCRFLAEHDFDVAVVIDGPKALHDRHRQKLEGGGSFDSVIAGIELLKKYGVAFSTITHVHRDNEDYPLEIYHLLKELGSTRMEFNPVVERDANAKARRLGLRFATPASLTKRLKCQPRVSSWSVTPIGFGQFLNAIFDEWVRQDVGTVSIEHFNSAMSSWSGKGPTICAHKETCGKKLTVEHNGTVYACHQYVYPEFERGQIEKMSFSECLSNREQLQFGSDKKRELSEQCRSCEYLFACNGGCPKQRFSRSLDGQVGFNYLCVGYKAYFRHVEPYMRTFAQLERAGKEPESIMQFFGASPEQRRKLMAV